MICLPSLLTAVSSVDPTLTDRLVVLYPGYTRPSIPVKRRYVQWIFSIGDISFLVKPKWNALFILKKVFSWKFPIRDKHVFIHIPRSSDDDGE